MNGYQKTFNEVYNHCHNYFLDKKDYAKIGKYNLVSKHYVRMFLCHEQIIFCIGNIKSLSELKRFFSELNLFFQTNNSKISRYDLGCLFVSNWQVINLEMLYYFCKIANIYIGIIQNHVFPEIRKKIQILLNQSEFDLKKCLQDIIRLHILLKYCRIKTSSYLEDWFKINQPWEGEECLQNPIAQKNIRILLKNFKKSI